MVEHTQAFRRQQSANRLRVLKGLKKIAYQKFLKILIRCLTIIILQASTQRAETLQYEQRNQKS